MGNLEEISLMRMNLSFFGAAGTVTGSKYLLESDGTRLFVDCGLFQGYKQLRERNWMPFPVDPGSVDAVLLTHAHLDHSGYLPLLIREGYRGAVIATAATVDLCRILLPDSGHLMEADARFANRHGFSRHRPALPLYDQADALRSLKFFRPVAFHEPISLPGGCVATFRRAGHIVGAATIQAEIGGLSVVFSGDLGRYGASTMPDPEAVTSADYLVVESTYGNRLHVQASPEAALAEVINHTLARGGSVIIPAFAVGRTQSLLFHLGKLRRSAGIPDCPIYLDSPMAVHASEIFCRHAEQTRLSAAECRAACAVARYVEDVEESKRLDRDPMPKVIISASGMATGGRILHHLKHYAPDARNTILIAGFQAGGTRGARLLGGDRELKIHGGYVPVRAEVANLDMLSAHADRNELLRWLKGFIRPPRMTFVTHGEPEAADALRHAIKEQLGWPVRVPEHGEVASLTA
jgi:metallo-beta-lactamase family protein